MYQDRILESVGRRLIGVGWLLAVWLGWAGLPVGAHQINASFTTLSIRPDMVRLAISIDEHELMTGFDLDANQDGILWREEMVAGIPEVFDYVEQKVTVKVDGQLLEMERVRADVQPDNKGEMFMRLMFRAEVQKPPVEVELEVDLFTRFGREHKNLVRIMPFDKPLVQAVLVPENNRQVFVVGERQDSWLDQLGQFFSRLFQ